LWACSAAWIGGRRMRIDLKRLLENKYTYKTRSGYSHLLKTKVINEKDILVYYEVGGKIKRSVSRIFPQYLDITNRFMWVLGFINGEGLKSINSVSSMYRFAVTNNDPSTIKNVLKVLDESKLFKINNLPINSIKINYGNKCFVQSLKSYWSKELGLTKEKIKLALKPQKQKKAKYGTATLYISDVLLRRVMDIISNHINEQIFSSSPESASAF